MKNISNTINVKRSYPLKRNTDFKNYNDLKYIDDNRASIHGISNSQLQRMISISRLNLLQI